MLIVDKVNAFLAKFVGPNAAHMIDALIGVALVGVPTAAGVLIYSAPARLFLLHHATLGAVVTAVVGLGFPAVTALASKFRKASGSQATLVDQLAQLVEQTLATHDAKTVQVIQDALTAASAPADTTVATTTKKAAATA